MTTIPTMSPFPHSTPFQSIPSDDDIGMGPRQNAHDEFDFIPFVSRPESPAVPGSEMLNFIESICKDFTIPAEVKIPDRRIISIFATIATKNDLPFQPGNVYHVFEHANLPCSLDNAVRTLALAGTVNIRSAIFSDNEGLKISPHTQTIRNFEELIQWYSI